MVKIKRVYEPIEKSDGYRVFVDLLWPRGIKKNELYFDEWPKELCPSTKIRKEFAHKASKFAEFRQQYQKELHSPEAQRKILELRRKAKRGAVTLLFAARDENINHAVVLQKEIENS